MCTRKKVQTRGALFCRDLKATARVKDESNEVTRTARLIHGFARLCTETVGGYF